VDPQVNWLWGWGAPDDFLKPDDFSIRWKGWLKAPKAGQYRLIAYHDDGVRVWLDGKPVIDKWNGVGRTDALVELSEGAHTLRVDYYEARGWAHMSLHWEQLGGFKEQIIPAEALFYEKGAAELATLTIP
jgi:hypothetical protein